MDYYPGFCKERCKLFEDGKTGQECKAGYKPPAVTWDKAITKVLHGGEYPCSFHPERDKVSKFLRSIAHKAILKPYATQWVSRIHFNIKENNDER